MVGGSWMAGYGKVRLTFDPELGEVSGLTSSIGANQGGTADAAVATVVNKWQEAAAQELSTVIGYTEAGIPNGSAALYNLITDSWLFAYPEADIVMTNGGGVRQSIPSGDITRGTIVGVLPFQNNLVELEKAFNDMIFCLQDRTWQDIEALEQLAQQVRDVRDAEAAFELAALIEDVVEQKRRLVEPNSQPL